MKSNLKPRRDDLLATLDAYRMQLGANLSDLEFEALTAFTTDAVSIIKRLSRIALKNVTQELRSNFRFHFTAEDSLSPKAGAPETMGLYRISIPLRFVHELMNSAATRNGELATSIGDYYRTSILLAILAAFGHELNHVFSNHIFTEPSLAQETNSDYRAGMLLWSWLQRDDIRKATDVSTNEIELALVFGALHLVSMFDPHSPDNHMYLAALSRWQVICGGAAFAADKKLSETVGNRITEAMKTMGSCPDGHYSSARITQAWAAMNVSAPAESESIKSVSKAFDQIRSEAFRWYQDSVHLRPIRKVLMQMLKREGKKRG